MRGLLPIMLVLALITPLLGQNPPASPQTPAASDLEQQLLKALAKFEYKAKRDVPAADSIFVEKGKIQPAMYKMALDQGGVLLKAGQKTKVSSVKIMDHGVQVFFETDKCAMINVAADDQEVPKMALAQLVEFATKSVAALFEAVSEEGATPPPAESKEKKDEKKTS